MGKRTLVTSYRYVPVEAEQLKVTPETPCDTSDASAPPSYTPVASTVQTALVVEEDEDMGDLPLYSEEVSSSAARITISEGPDRLYEGMRLGSDLDFMRMLFFSLMMGPIGSVIVACCCMPGKPSLSQTYGQRVGLNLFFAFFSIVVLFGIQETCYPWRYYLYTLTKEDPHAIDKKSISELAEGFDIKKTMETLHRPLDGNASDYDWLPQFCANYDGAGVMGFNLGLFAQIWCFVLFFSAMFSMRSYFVVRRMRQ